jgi:hypothetical protein
MHDATLIRASQHDTVEYRENKDTSRRGKQPIKASA